MSPEESMHTRVVEERARRIAIQATVSRRVDERLRMRDPALWERSHAERVRALMMLLGDVGATDTDEWGTSARELQDALTDLAAEVQAWMESNLREASQ